MIQELNQTELQEIGAGEPLTAAGVGAALLGVGTGAIIGVAIVVGTYYLVKALK